MALLVYRKTCMHTHEHTNTYAVDTQTSVYIDNHSTRTYYLYNVQYISIFSIVVFATKLISWPPCGLKIIIKPCTRSALNQKWSERKVNQYQCREWTKGLVTENWTFMVLRDARWLPECDQVHGRSDTPFSVTASRCFIIRWKRTPSTCVVVKSLK